MKGLLKAIMALGVTFGKMLVGANDGKAIPIRYAGDKQLAGLIELSAKAKATGAVISVLGDDWNLVRNPAGEPMRNADGTVRTKVVNGIAQPELRERDRFVLLTAVSYDTIEDSINAG